jgi:uncharacterized protein with PIN domain
MLGRLAHWLRALGYDTLYDPTLSDQDLERLARREGRTLLTRDRRLPAETRAGDVLVLVEERPLACLREVIERRALAPVPLTLRRCLVCNGALSAARREAVGGRVPEDILKGAGALRACGGCGRVYWEGSHTRRMRAALSRIVGADGYLHPEPGPTAQKPNAP